MLTCSVLFPGAASVKQGSLEGPGPALPCGESPGSAEGRQEPQWPETLALGLRTGNKGPLSGLPPTGHCGHCRPRTSLSSS